MYTMGISARIDRANKAKTYKEAKDKARNRKRDEIEFQTRKKNRKSK